MSPESGGAARFDPIRLARGAVLVMAMGFIAAYAAVALLRVGYPFEMERLEGAMADHVRTILAGRPLYGPPSLRFTALMYSPAYFYLGAAVTRLQWFGAGVFPLRWISILSSAGLFVVIARLVQRETGSRWAAIVAVGLFAATYGWTGGWFDLARVDSFYLLVTTLAVYVLRWHTSAAALVVAGLLLALGFLTKQSGLVVAAPLCVWTLASGTRRWQAFGLLTGTCAAAIAGTTVAFDRYFHGWYVYYVFQVPAQHPIAREQLLGFWRYDLFGRMPVAAGATVAWLAWALTRRSSRSVGLFYTAVAAGYIASAWFSRLHSMSYINVVLPAHLAVSVIGSIALAAALRTIVGWAAGGRAAYAQAAVLLACAAQFARLAYPVWTFVPSAADVQTGQALVRWIAERPGPVFTPFQTDLPIHANREPLSNAVPLVDVIRGGTGKGDAALREELDHAFSTHEFAAILMDPGAGFEAWLPVEKHYRAAGSAVPVRSRFWRPLMIWIPR